MERKLKIEIIMLKYITNPTEMKEYVGNFSSLINLVKETEQDFALQYLTNYFSLLKFKIDNNLMQKLKIDTSSGIPSIGHIAQLIAEKNNLELKLQCSFTSEEIRDRFIKEIDSQKNFDTAKTINSLIKRYYLSELEKADINEDISLNATLLESGDSDLIRIIIAGYSLPLNSVCSHAIDLYAQKGLLNLRKRKIKIDTKANVSLPGQFNNKLINWFGLQSNMIYEFIRKERDFEPRRVRRTIFAPFYSKFFEPTKDAERIDPHYLEIYKDILPQQTAYILSIHTDTSTKHFDPFYKNNGKEKPNITIEHKYCCADKKIANQLKKFVPKEEIITPRGK